MQNLGILGASGVNISLKREILHLTKHMIPIIASNVSKALNKKGDDKGRISAEIFLLSLNQAYEEYFDVLPSWKKEEMIGVEYEARDEMAQIASEKAWKKIERILRSSGFRVTEINGFGGDDGEFPPDEMKISSGRRGKYMFR